MTLENHTTTSLIIGYDISHTSDNKVLVIGKRGPSGSVEIVNAFQGDEAEELYNKLITKKENKKC